jgi:hypothetical protein
MLNSYALMFRVCNLDLLATMIQLIETSFLGCILNLYLERDYINTL